MDDIDKLLDRPKEGPDKRNAMFMCRPSMITRKMMYRIMEQCDLSTTTELIEFLVDHYVYGRGK